MYPRILIKLQEPHKELTKFSLQLQNITKEKKIQLLISTKHSRTQTHGVQKTRNGLKKIKK